MEKSKSEYQILSEEFESLVKSILEKHGFAIQSHSNEDYDFRAISGNSIIYFEIKAYRDRIPKHDLLKNAYKKLSSISYEAGIKRVLVITSEITDLLKNDILEESGVIIWDANTLFALAAPYPHLYFKLETLLARTTKWSATELLFLINPETSETIFAKLNATTTSKSVAAQDKGRTLCIELHKFKPGRKDARNFELKCTEILKYLFDNDTDLTLWEEQPTTDDKLHRFDLLCRIIFYPNTFWTELASDFHTRYVLFEFKNYKEKIKQGQIYSTEKYLFLAALRSVSFVISREGGDTNAVKAAKGALKEAGKLIIILTITDLCEMLTLKDNGDEPSRVLRERIDNLLVSLTR